MSTCCVFPIGVLKPDPIHLRFSELCGICFITAAQPPNAIWHSATLQLSVNLMLGHWEGGRGTRKNRKPKDSLYLSMFRSMSTKRGEHDIKDCRLCVLASRALNWWFVYLFPSSTSDKTLEIKMIKFRVCLYTIWTVNANSTLRFGWLWDMFLNLNDYYIKWMDLYMWQRLFWGTIRLLSDRNWSPCSMRWFLANLECQNFPLRYPQQNLPFRAWSLLIHGQTVML